MNQLNIRSGILFAIFAVLALTSATAHAATLNVMVTDAQSGEKLDRISITVIPQTGDSREGTSDAMGASQFAELPAGIYSISVSSLSYADKAVSNVELQRRRGKVGGNRPILKSHPTRPSFRHNLAAPRKGA